MSRKLNLLTAVVIFIHSGICHGQKLQFLYDCSDNICEEILNSDSSEIVDFSIDNKIYRDGLEYIFSYSYENEGVKYLVDGQGEALILFDNKDEHAIHEVSLRCDESEENDEKDYARL